MRRRLILIGMCLVNAAAFASPSTDVRDGQDIDFDLVGLNYSYTGVQSGSGSVTDAEAPPGCAPKAAGTLNMSINTTNFGLPFSVTIPLNGTLLDPARVRWTTDSNPNVNVPINLNGQTINVILRRIWGQITGSCSFTTVFFDTVCNHGYNVRMVDTASNVDTWINVEAYVGFVSPFTRIDYQARDFDFLNFAGVARGEFDALSYAIVAGQDGGGALSDLHTSDDGYVFVFSDVFASEGAVEFTTTGPTPTTGVIAVGMETGSDREDILQRTYCWNYQTSAWEIVHTALATVADSAFLRLISTNANRFIDSTSRESKTRVNFTPQADYDASDGWFNRIDEMHWEVAP